MGIKLQLLRKKLKVPSCEIYDPTKSSLFVVLGALSAPNMSLPPGLHQTPFCLHMHQPIFNKPKLKKKKHINFKQYTSKPNQKALALNTI
jgi:hypothetical protein